MAITYELVAEFKPFGEEGYETPEMLRSAFSSARTIYMNRPQLAVPIMNLKNVISHEVGGFVGMFTSKFVANITFDKNEYYLGEKATVRFSIDNTDCKKDVKSCKLKLYRHYNLKCNLGV